MSPADQTRSRLAPHAASREFLTLALDHEWSASYVHGEDTGGNPYINVNAARGDEGEAVRITWHTRQTSTYRLFSVLTRGTVGGWRDGTLKSAKALIADSPTELNGSELRRGDGS